MRPLVRRSVSSRVAHAQPSGRGSCDITSVPSAARRTSNSIMSAPISMAFAKAARVFSGASRDAPRWATICVKRPRVNGVCGGLAWRARLRSAASPLHRACAAPAALRRSSRRRRVYWARIMPLRSMNTTNGTSGRLSFGNWMKSTADNTPAVPTGQGTLKLRDK